MTNAKRKTPLQRKAELAATMGPRLAALLEAGTVRSDGREYTATASDGTDVTLGCVGEESAVEFYLRSHPAPSDW